MNKTKNETRVCPSAGMRRWLTAAELRLRPLRAAH
jgi:hypothetical protein